VSTAIAAESTLGFMKLLITGASGRIGRATYIGLSAEHEVIGFDSAPSSTSDIVGSIEDVDSVRKALRGVDAVIHIAAIHAPHLGHFADEAFEAINVAATGSLARLAADAGTRTFIFTSTTALYGSASTPGGRAAWIDEKTQPLPLTIYHRTKLKAESLLEDIALESGLSITAIRMSRCFPEPAPIMAAYRLHRGIDVRDVADAHAIAALAPSPGFRRFVVSGSTPFMPQDADLLLENASEVIEMRCPELAAAFRRRNWRLPSSIDRVYSPVLAARVLNWRPKYGFEEVLAQLDRRSLEVLPPRHNWSAEE
jgi:UDP-glucose 4-epimerase